MAICGRRFAILATVALVSAAAFSEGVSFDFRAHSLARHQREQKSGCASLLKADAAWRLKADIHSATTAKDSPIRRRRGDFVTGSWTDGEMRIATDASFSALAQEQGVAATVLSGSYETSVRLPDVSGGVYRVTFAYRMMHSAGNLGGCLVWQKDADGKNVGKLKMFKLSDFEDDYIPYSGTLTVAPGVTSLEIAMRIYGTGELLLKDISLCPVKAMRPIEAELAMMGLLDNRFAIGENQMGALCFGWRQTDDTAYDRSRFSFMLELPSGYDCIGSTFARKTDRIRTAGGGSRLEFAFDPAYDGKVRKSYGAFKYLGVAVQAQPGAACGRATFRVLYDGREVAEPVSFSVFTVPAVKGKAPKRLLGGYDLGGAYANYDAAEARRAFARLTADAGLRCLVLGGESAEALVPYFRTAGVTKLLTGWSGCANGYVLDGRISKPVPEDARFVFRDAKACPFAKRAVCPSEIYEEGPFFRETFLPALKKTLAGADGLWANWEPYTFSGQGCVCERCEKKRAVFKGEEHDFRSREHAKVVKTIDKWVRAYSGGEKSMGFVPGVSAKQMTSGWRRVYGRSEFKEYDYAASLEWIEPWGPYVYWNARTPYAGMMHPTVLTFAAAKNIREMTDADYGAKAPKLMAFPQGTQGADWVTQPEYLEMAYDAHFFNRWHACLAYYFPRGYDARYWRAVANAMTRAAKYEDFILDGVRIDATTFVVPPVGYPVCRKPEEYLDGVENVCLLPSVAYELKGVRVVAVFNYVDDRACDFSLRCSGLADGRYRLTDEMGVVCGVHTAAALASGVSLSVPATRTRVFEVRRAD